MFQHQRHELPVVLKRFDIAIYYFHAVCDVSGYSGKLWKAAIGLI
jgi:hypothetical protein